MIQLSKVLLFFALFLTTLVNHGIWSGTIAAVLLIIYILIKHITIKKTSVKEIYILLLLLVLSILHYLLYAIYELDAVFRNAFYGNTYLYVLCIALWFLIRNISLDKKRKHLIDLIAPILKFHVSIFFVQFSVYFLTGYYIDLLKAVTGEESRYISFDSSLVGIGSFRPTGLFAEPSNYSFVVLVLSVLLITFNKYSKNRKLIGLAVISMFLSFSTTAVFTALLFVTYIFVDQKLYKKTWLTISLIVLIVISSATLYTLFQTQLDRLDGRAGNIRMELIETVSNRDSDNVILAYGAYGMETDLYRLSTNQSRGDRVSSLNDAGILVYMWARFGYLGILGFIIICFLIFKISKKNLFLFLIISLTKISILYPVFILYLALLLSIKKPQNLTPKLKS